MTERENMIERAAIEALGWEHMPAIVARSKENKAGASANHQWAVATKAARIALRAALAEAGEVKR